MSLTTDQIREAFELFDSDCSGAINAEELELVLKGLGFVDMPKQEISALMKKMDKDNSGEIEFPEFEAVVSKMTQRGTLDEIWKAYKLFDVDQKGRITMDDLKRVASEEATKVEDDVLQRILKECCEYPSKGMSFEEWKHIMLSETNATK
eukprot:PhM_4_TR6499/c0_g1_i1/m.61595/K16465/CETN1; centrin-1